MTNNLKKLQEAVDKLNISEQEEVPETWKDACEEAICIAMSDIDGIDMALLENIYMHQDDDESDEHYKARKELVIEALGRIAISIPDRK
jgi:3-phosphoglycerate kinase